MSMSINNILAISKSKAFPGYVITFGIEFLIMAISVILFKIVKIKYADLGFAEFSINKRLVGFLMPLMTMGMGVSLPKLLPTVNAKQQLEIHYSALIISATLFLVALVVFFLISGQFSKLIFGDFSHKKMCLASLFYINSLILHGCVYNYFRGKFNFTISSILQLMNIGIFPLMTWFIAHDILQYLIILTSLTLLLLSIINLIFIPIVKISFSDLRININKIVRYGIQRMPGDVVLGLFLAIPTLIVTNYFSITVGGNIAFCLSLFNIVIALMSPVNIILLPKAAKIAYDKDFVLFKQVCNKLLFLSIGIGISTLFVVYFFAEHILELFSLTNHHEVAGFLVVIFMGIIGYSVFSVIRSIIDAFYEKAWVTLIIIVSFLFFLICMGILRYFDLFNTKNILLSFSLSINILGILTYYTLTLIYKKIRS